MQFGKSRAQLHWLRGKSDVPRCRRNRRAVDELEEARPSKHPKHIELGEIPRGILLVGPPERAKRLPRLLSKLMFRSSVWR